MKTIIKTILVVTLMFGTLIGYANNNTEPANIVTVKKGNALTIKNEYGITIYKQVLQSAENDTKTFDLTNLEDGLYTTELEKDFEIIVEKLEVKDGSVTFYKNENEIIFKPVIRTEGNLVMISKIEFGDQPLNVTLYYQNNIIVSDKLNGEKILNRVYKLSEAEKGAYKVVINTDNRTYVKDFTI